MANNYCELSCAFSLKAHELKEAEQLVEKAVEELENNPEEGYCGVDISVEMGAVYFSGHKANPGHVAYVAQALMDGLKRNNYFVFSWAYTCSKLRVDEFGGGACAIRRGKEPVWVDPQMEALRKIGEL